jgi:hypothetical protein
MNQKLVYAIVVVAAVGLAVGVWWFWDSPNNANFPQGTHWMCMDRACGGQATLTMKQLGQHNKEHFGKRPFCPKCKKETMRADVCRHCGKWYPQAPDSYVCPFCKQDNRPQAT